MANDIASAIARIKEMKKQHAELTEFNSGYKNAIINVLAVLEPFLQEPKLKAGEFNDKGIEQLVQDYIGDEAIGDMEDILDGFGRYLRDRGLLRNTKPAIGLIKEARIMPGALSNFGNSIFNIQVELTPQEKGALDVLSLNKPTIKIMLL